MIEASANLISGIVILIVAVWSFQQWASNFNSKARQWFFISIATLLMMVILDRFVSDGGMTFLGRFSTVMEFIVIAGLPYALFQFTACFYRPSNAVKVLVTICFLGLVLITACIPAEYFTENYVTPDWFLLYIILFLAYWMLLAGFSAWKLWMGGRKQPQVIRRRMKTLAIGSIGTVSGLVFNFFAPLAFDNPYLIVGITLCQVTAVLLLALGYNPPASIRRNWRQDAEKQLRQAATSLLEARSEKETGDILLPKAVSILGASSAGWYNKEGINTTSLGEGVPEKYIDLDKIPENPHVTDNVRRGHDRVEMKLKEGVLVFWVSDYTPFFGQEEIDVVKQIGVMFDLSGERVQRQIEQEKRSQAETVSEVLKASVIPHRMPNISSLQLGAVYRPAYVLDGLGGDWYDVFQFSPHQVLLVVGDVMGKGVEAAAIMNQIRNGLRAYITDGSTPAQALHRLNNLCIKAHPETMATVWCGVWNIREKTVMSANAGHPPPLIHSKEKTFFWDHEAGLPIGVLERTEYKNYKDTYDPNDQIIIYTDGLVERRDRSIMKGLDNLKDWWEWRTPQEQAEHLIEQAVEDGAGGDDIAILVVMPTSPQILKLEAEANPDELIHFRVALEQWFMQMINIEGIDLDKPLDKPFTLSKQEAEALKFKIIFTSGEALSNSVEHAYSYSGKMQLKAWADEENKMLWIETRDFGKWRPKKDRDRGRGKFLMEEMSDVFEREVDNGTKVLLGFKV